MTRKTEYTKLPFPATPLDPAEKVRLESRNALRQFDAAMALVDESLTGPKPFRLRPSHLNNLNRIATEDVSPAAGVYRTEPIHITNSPHKPPPPHECPRLVEEMCDYVNTHWDRSPIHLSAYLMWRHNWIHPFDDGNGRTSRAISYAVLCIKLGFKLPGVKTVPDQISQNKGPYYMALEAADAAVRADGAGVDVSMMESLLGELLAVQLVFLHDEATGH